MDIKLKLYNKGNEKKFLSISLSQIKVIHYYELIQDILFVTKNLFIFMTMIYLDLIKWSKTFLVCLSFKFTTSISTYF
jgi:hypothetical protein